MSAVALFTKNDDNCDLAVAIATSIFGQDLVVISGDGFTPNVFVESHETILSYRSPWVLPSDYLSRAKLALNWHPGSKDYPGYACYSFAIYNEAKTYGCTCHHMSETIDSGPIVEERTFPVFSGESVLSLQVRTLAVMLASFHDVCCLIATGRPLPNPNIKWGRDPFRRKDLEELLQIHPDFSLDEIVKRIRATDYPGFPGPSVTIEGLTFEFRP